MEKQKLYTITCTQDHLRLIADAVEDWSRFLAGQCEMHNATSRLAHYHEASEALETYVKPFIVPELPRNASYGWSGGSCPNEPQRKAIAMSYGIYRQILHFFAMRHPEIPNVYLSETLTCPEQGGLITIKEA